MEMDGPNDVIIHSTWRCATVKVNWELLHQVWMEFAEWVRREVREAFPGIEQYEVAGWDKWFAGYIHEERETIVGTYDEDWECIRKAKQRWRKESAHHARQPDDNEEYRRQA